MQIDTTIPGQSAEIVTPDVGRKPGTAGRIGIVGIFERGDYNTAYFFDNPRDAQDTMGSSASYTGSKVIDYAFKQDKDNNNYGATDLVCVRAGATAKASYQHVSSAPANVLLITAKSGGIWANGSTGGLTVTLAAGTITGYKWTLKLNSVVVEQWDNVTTTQLKDKINGYSKYVTASATAAELARTPATVSDANMASGTETTSPTTTDIGNALNTILTENVDILILTDTVSSAYLPTIETYLNSRLAANKPAIAILALATTESVSTTLTNVAAADSQLMAYIYQYIDIGTDTLTESESAARYAGFVAGLPVNESPTNKVISDITGLNAEYTFDADDNGYALVDKGVTLFKLMSREKQTYGVVSAVTGYTGTDDTGRKAINSELYAMRILAYTINYLNMEDWLGRTGITATIASAKGELNNRAKQLISDGIIEDYTIDVAADSENDELVYADVGIMVPKIMKHLRFRIQLAVES